MGTMLGRGAASNDNPLAANDDLRLGGEMARARMVADEP
jgi:hypothetical protein